MKKIFFLLFILSMAIIKMSGQEKLKAQAPFQLYGTPADFNKLRVWEYLRLPKDTLSNADTGSVSYKNGYMYLKDATGHHVKIAKYSDIAGGGGTGDVDSVTFSPSQNVDTVKYWIAGTGYVAGVVDVKCGLVQPGTVVHDSLLKFTVSPSIHRSCLDGIRYTTTLTHITLGAADGTFGRYDVIALEGSSVVVVPGTPAAAPVLPQLSAGQTMLTFISIPATATVPSGPFTTIIYDENTEFTGSASGVTVDFGNFTDPYHLVKATSTGAVTSASTISYTSSDFKISSYHTLRFFIKLKAAFANNTRFQLSWLRDGVTQSGTVTMQNNNYGFLRAAGGYQEIIIPISDFGPFLTDSVDAFKIQLTGSNGSGFYIDYIQIQGGIPQAPTGTIRDRFAVSGEDANATQNRYFNGRDQFFFNLDSIASFALTARSTAFKNISGSNWLSYSATAMAINPLSTGIPLTFSNIPASDTAMYVLGINAAGRAVLQLKSAISGGTPTLTDTQIAFGDGSNLMTSSSRFTWDDANKTLVLGNAIHEPKLTFNSPPTGQSYIQMKQDGLDNWIITNNYDGPSGNSRLKFSGFNLAGSFQGARLALSASDGKVSMDGYGSSSPFNLATDTTNYKIAVFNSSGDIHRMFWSGVGGGGGTNIYNSDGSLTANRTVSLNAKDIYIDRGNGGYLDIHPNYTDIIHYFDATHWGEFYGQRSAGENYWTWSSKNGSDQAVLALFSYGLQATSARIQFGQGVDVASAAGAITLSVVGNVTEITGTNAITLISNIGWQNGSEITLLFTSTATLTDGTANSGTDIGMELAGNANFVGSADDVVTLVLCEIGGVQRWREKCRSVN